MITENTQQKYHFCYLLKSINEALLINKQFLQHNRPTLWTKNVLWIKKCSVVTAIKTACCLSFSWRCSQRCKITRNKKIF